MTDAEYLKWKAAQADYRTSMADASARALGGQMTPAEWLNGTPDGKWQGQKKVSADYHGLTLSTFHGAPHYVNGAEGLLNEYESLYDQASVPPEQGGGVDYAKLDQLRAKFAQDHANDPMITQMQQILGQNDTRFPMQALYHKTIDAYGKWQENYAQRNGLDVNTLRQEISQENALYSDKAASGKYLSQHKELVAYNTAKKTQFAHSPQGLMWGLFFDTTAVATYMRAHHLTAEQVETEAQAQP